MAESIEKGSMAGDTLTANEAVRFLWEWRTYRNEGFWQTFYLMGFAVIILTIAPYFFPDMVKKLGAAVLAFPIVTFLLSGFTSYLLVVEYKLYKVADRRYRELLGKFVPQDIQGWLFRRPLGKVIAITFALFGTVVQVISGAVLLSLAYGVLP